MGLKYVEPNVYSSTRGPLIMQSLETQNSSFAGQREAGMLQAQQLPTLASD